RAPDPALRRPGSWCRQNRSPGRTSRKTARLRKTAMPSAPPHRPAGVPCCCSGSWLRTAVVLLRIGFLQLPAGHLNNGQAEDQRHKTHQHKAKAHIAAEAALMQLMLRGEKGFTAHDYHPPYPAAFRAASAIKAVKC